MVEEFDYKRWVDHVSQLSMSSSQFESQLSGMTEIIVEME
jgi:hypothetical protein